MYQNPFPNFNINLWNSTSVSQFHYVSQIPIQTQILNFNISFSISSSENSLQDSFCVNLCWVLLENLGENQRQILTKCIITFTIVWYLYSHVFNSFNMKFSIHCSSRWPWFCPFQLSLGFTLEFLEKIENKVCDNTLYHWHAFLDNVAS